MIDLQLILLLPSWTYRLSMCAKQTFLTAEQRNVTFLSAAGKQDMKAQPAESLFARNRRHHGIDIMQPSPALSMEKSIATQR